KKGQGRQARKTAEQAGKGDHQGKGEPSGGELREGQGALPPEKDTGAYQEDRGTVDILRYPYGQCTGDRQTDVGRCTGKSGITTARSERPMGEVCPDIKKIAE